MATLHSLFSQYKAADCRKHLHKAMLIEKALEAGIDYAYLGGQQLKLAKHLIRFKLGKYRLIFKYAHSGYTPDCLIQRKHLHRFLKRR